MVMNNNLDLDRKRIAAEENSFQIKYSKMFTVYLLVID